MHRIEGSRLPGVRSSRSALHLLITTAVLLSLSTAPLAAQTDTQQTLFVTVSDSADRPIRGAIIFIEGAADTGRTDELGRAVLRSAERRFSLVVRRIGFGERRIEVTLGGGERHDVRIALSPIQALPVVRVTAAAPLPQEIERRRLASRGWFYGPEDLDKVQQVRTLLERTPGTRVDGTGEWAVRMQSAKGNCWADLYVDGRLSAPTQPSFGTRRTGITKVEELHSIPHFEIYAVEVYTRGAQAPQDIVRLRDGCGVILVWTHSWARQRLAEEARRQPASP